MAYEYKFKATISGVNAQAVGEELEALEKPTSTQIVQYAEKHKKSELYKCFEWNNDKAAAKYREEQARQILMNLVIVQTAKRGREMVEVEVRAYENIREGEGKGVYIPIRDILGSEEYAEILFSEIQRGLLQLMGKMEKCKMLAPDYKGFERGINQAIRSLHKKGRKPGAA
ncbi:hypothetical protein FACS189479_05500 [Spirochaetia bacterium]|nr:hypothetical protein FACS189479_05500 [Spirochaetia bacterium]